MTSDNSPKFELDNALRTFLGDAGNSMGLQFQEIASSEADRKTYLVKDPASEQLLGVVTLDPFTRQANSHFSNSKDDRAVLAVSISMNLKKPEEGAVVLDESELSSLFKLSGHAFSALAAKKSYAGADRQKGFTGFTPTA